MVKKITVFAILVAMAMAAPTTLAPTFLDRRTLPSGFGGSALRSITTSSGWSASVAGGLEACRAGATPGSISTGDKAALLAWLEGAGAAYIDFVTCAELKKWCSGTESFVIGAWAQLALDVALAKDEAVSAAGSVISFLNGAIFEGISQDTCLCSILSGADQSALLTWLESSAAADIEAAILGSLKTCAVGGIAASLSSSAQAALSAWLKSAECALSAEMKRWVSDWLTVGGKGSISGGASGSAGKSTGGSISDSAGFSVVLTSGSISNIQVFIGGSAFAGLDVSVQAGLHACAAGGVAGAMDLSIQVSLSSWLASPTCPLDSGLKASVGFWLKGIVGAGVQSAGSPGFPYIATGNSIAGNLKSTGCLIESAQSSLSSFCFGSAGAALDVGILGSLKKCAAGELAASMEASAAVALSAWLSGPSCPLSAEMRGTVIAWMSFGITGAAGAKAGIGAGAGAGYVFSASEIAAIQAAMSGSVSMSATVKSAFGVAIAGQAAGAISIAGRAETSAFLCGNAGAGFGGAELHASLIGWMCGSVGSAISGGAPGTHSH